MRSSRRFAPALLFAPLLTVSSTILVGANITPVALPVNEMTPLWEGPQFVEADRQGRVFFFRADTLEVYPVTKSGAFGKPVKIETVLAGGRGIQNAVLSADGSRWLIQDSHSVRLFVDGKEKPLPPLQWAPKSIGFRRNDPIVAVLPLPLGGNSVDLEKLGTPPWLLELGGDRWTHLVDLEGMDVSEIFRQLKTGAFNDTVAKIAVSLLGDRQGRLWTAKEHAYHVQRFTPSGRSSLELIVQGGRVEKRAENKGIEIRRSSPTQNPSEATREPRQEKKTFFGFTARQVILDLAEGRDGKIYFLVQQPNGESALDRFDPAQAVLERIPLQVKAKGRFTLAAGKDGLYMAAWNGKQGRWRLSWDLLEQAAWEKVEDVSIDGLDTPGA